MRAWLLRLGSSYHIEDVPNVPTAVTVGVTMAAVGGACSILLLLVFGAYGGPECVHAFPYGSCMLG